MAAQPGPSAAGPAARPGDAEFEQAVLHGLILTRRELTPPGSWVGGNGLDAIAATDRDGVPLEGDDYINFRIAYTFRLLEEVDRYER